jgi:hypothetical protein
VRIISVQRNCGGKGVDAATGKTAVDATLPAEDLLLPDFAAAHEAALISSPPSQRRQRA